MTEGLKNIINSLFSGISTLNCRISEKQNKRIIHTSKTDVSDVEHFSRIIHIVNQSSIYGTVSNWREQFDWQRKQKEVRKDEIFDQKYVDKYDVTRDTFFNPENYIGKLFTQKQSRLREVLSETIHFSKTHEGTSFLH